MAKQQTEINDNFKQAVKAFKAIATSSVSQGMDSEICQAVSLLSIHVEALMKKCEHDTTGKIATLQYWKEPDNRTSLDEIQAQLSSIKKLLSIKENLTQPEMNACKGMKEFVSDVNKHKSTYLDFMLKGLGGKIVGVGITAKLTRYETLLNNSLKQTMENQPATPKGSSKE